jgi:hypothetical protein
MTRWGAIEGVALAVHRLHGTRGLSVAATSLLVLALVEGFLPPGLDLTFVMVPVVAILAIGLFTLPREGVAAQQRARSLLTDAEAPNKMIRRMIWLVLLVVLLLPRVFLGLYGIPHMSPLTGLLEPSLHRRITLVAIYCVLLVSILYLRSGRRYAPHIVPQRPKDLSKQDRSHSRRDVLLGLVVAILVLWSWLLYGFWRPFSLLEWPPSLDSLGQGVRGVSSIAFALVIPATLFVTAVAHLSLLHDIWREGQWRRRATLASLSGVHVAIAFLAIALHVYDLLWIVRYQSLTLF